MQLGVGKLAGAIDGNEEIALALFRLYLGNVNMEVANRILLELPSRLVAFDFR
jgi:hypothetical protein